MAALRQAERLAIVVQADDVLAIVCGNQANVAMMQHRYEQALALAERSVALQEQPGPAHGLAVALATLGQICVASAISTRAEEALHRALDVRSPIQFHETTGAVFDTLAQIHLIRGGYEQASEYLRQAARAYGAYGAQTQPLVRVVGARARGARWRCGAATPTRRSTMPTRSSRRRTCPPADALQAELIAVEALLAAQRRTEAERAARRASPTRSTPRHDAGAWGEYLRLRGALHAKPGAPTEAYHDFAQSVSVFELLGERYQAALSHLALGQLAARAGRAVAARRAISTDAIDDLRGARRRARSRRDARARSAAADRHPAPASSSACQRTPTMRWCGGSWTRRRCRNCWPGRPRPRCSRRATRRRRHLSSQRDRRRSCASSSRRRLRCRDAARSLAAQRVEPSAGASAPLIIVEPIGP